MPEGRFFFLDTFWERERGRGKENSAELNKHSMEYVRIYIYMVMVMVCMRGMFSPNPYSHSRVSKYLFLSLRYLSILLILAPYIYASMNIPIIWLEDMISVTVSEGVCCICGVSVWFEYVNIYCVPSLTQTKKKTPENFYFYSYYTYIHYAVWLSSLNRVVKGLFFFSPFNHC